MNMDAQMRTSSADHNDWSQRRLMKNVLVASLAFLFLFTAFQALSNLQSSINCDDGLGLASLSTIYVSLILSSMFLPSIVIRILGLKWTLVASMSCYTLYSVANFWPGWGTLIPASALVGFSAAPLWSAKCTYLTTSGIKYGKLGGESIDAVVNRFFGIFFLMFQSAQIWGNLISSLVLQQGPDNDFRNDGTQICGVNDCPDTEGSNITDCGDDIEDKLVNTLMGIYTGCGLLAIFLIVVFLDPMEPSQQTLEGGKCDLFMATLRLLKDKRLLFLIPITIYSGLEQAFIAGDFTKSFVTCSRGVGWVGYVMICYGVTDSVSSLLSGRVAKYTGRIPIFVSGAIAQAVIIIVFFTWVPEHEDLAFLFVVAAVWGFGDAIWQTQINAIYGVYFNDRQEAAFSNYRLWESVGFAASFAYSNFLCVSTKLAILVSFLAIGITSYLFIEIKESRKELYIPTTPTKNDPVGIDGAVFSISSKEQ
ncbi:protein unc-93 homolog A-like [Anneissia japonica]|uniref:protein unc-93 homolog A-like n=1 Tax=Anneissia japonica TaxID=1529436 RepID=UPI001425ABE1|nr:protein unc-93 homolog A-like [Anneissia japonica]